MGIESSCDETSGSICQNGKVINNIIASQSIHEEYGGVVPELASREHQKNIIPTVDLALKQANISISELDAIACTQGPGLLGALLVGYTFAKSLSYALDIPLVNVHHMKAHILAHFIEDPKPAFPFLCLTVSGGHTQIVKVEDYNEMTVVGQTIDDAVGEAFDKGAKLLGLKYPGGPLIDQYAKKGDADRYTFAESRVKDFDFSFSGVKTSLLYFLRNELKSDPDFIRKNLEDICAGYQETLIQMLISKLTRASEYYGIDEIAMAGGVAANEGLRDRIQSEAGQRNWNIYIPKMEYCTDNAAMIAIAGYYQLAEGSTASMTDSPKPRMVF